MAAAGLLSRITGTGRSIASSAEVHDLLRQLSKDDFAFLRYSPPLVYHNDLTAPTRRFYWSEELGYAIWLRLWFESERRDGLSR